MYVDFITPKGRKELRRKEQEAQDRRLARRERISELWGIWAPCLMVLGVITLGYGVYWVLSSLF